MKIFKHNDKAYLQIKDHSFEILNGFTLGWNNENIIYIQCTTNRSSGIIKEYLPNKHWELQKKRYNGQMIFTLYNKTYFKYKSQSASIGNIVFIAPTEEGSKYLMIKWLLQWLELSDIDNNIEIIKKVFEDRHSDRYLTTLKRTNKDQEFNSIMINTNYWNFNNVIKDIKEEIANE